MLEQQNITVSSDRKTHRKNPRIIEAVSLKIGSFSHQEIHNDYFHIMLDKIKKRVTILAYNKTSQENSCSERIPQRRSQKQAELKLLIKRQNVKKIRIDPKQRKMLIVFRQAVIYKYQQKIWKLQQVWNNSQMVFDLSSSINCEKSDTNFDQQEPNARLTSQNSEQHFDLGIDQFPDSISEIEEQ